MSLLFLVMLSCACAGSHGYLRPRKACYGSEFSVSLEEMGLFTFHRELFFVPSKPGTTVTRPSEERIPVTMENGTTMDPRYEISSDKFIIREVTERDEGFLRFKDLLGRTVTLFRLGVEDCSSKVTKEFGSTDYYFKCPNNAYSLEFTPLENTYGSQSQVLWNRTNPQASETGGRGRLLNNKWMMNQITYEYVGYYTFRDENHKFISRNRVDVEERYPYSYVQVQGEDLHITFGMDPVLFDMTFQADADQSEKVLLMKQGDLFAYNTLTYEVFQDRFQKLVGPTLHITIEDLQPSDSGRFEFTDWKGNLALVVLLKVKERSPAYVRYIVAAVGILMVVFCCCYVRKRCCKKTTRKNHSVPDTEAAPDLQDNLPLPPSTSAHPSASHGPTYSYPLYHNKPGSTSQPPLDNHTDEPPTYDSLFPSNAEVAPATSAPPLLCSDTPYSDVYNSDKLNFL